MGGPGAVEAGVLRCEALARDQGRHDRARADGRPQRIDSHAAAGVPAADVRRVRRSGREGFAGLRVAAWAGRRRCFALRAAQGCGGRPQLSQPDEIRYGAQRVRPRGFRRSGDVRRRRRRPAVAMRARTGAADGAALFPFLEMLTFDRRMPPGTNATATVTLAYEARRKSRQKVRIDGGEEAGVILPWGETLRHGDVLATASGLAVRVIAASEPVMVIRCSHPRELARVAYH